MKMNRKKIFQITWAVLITLVALSTVLFSVGTGFLR